MRTTHFSTLESSTSSASTNLSSAGCSEGRTSSKCAGAFVEFLAARGEELRGSVAGLVLASSRCNSHDAAGSDSSARTPVRGGPVLPRSPRMGEAIEPLRDRRFHEEFERPASDGSSLGDGRSDQGDEDGLICGDSRGRGGFGDDERRSEGTPDARVGLSPGVGVAEAVGDGGSGTDPGGKKLDGVRR